MYIYYHRQLLHRGVGEGATPFPGLLHFTLDPYLIVLSVNIKGKVEQSRERSSALPYTFVQKLLKRESSGHPSLRLVNLLYIYTYVCIYIYIYISNSSTAGRKQ